MASPDAQLIRILEGLPLSSDGLDGLDGATPEAESPLVAAEPAQPPAAADSRVRRRKRTPKLWSAADEGRVDDLRAALEQRKDSFASSGPTARLASSSGGAVSSGPTRSINWCNDAGTTALHAASLSGHEACVQLLLDAHAALDPRQKGGATPLILAARQGHSECVARLLGAGADLARRDATGTALDNARSTSCWGVQGDDDEEDELEERLEGSNARCIEILEAAELQQKHEQTFLLGQRQREAAALAHDAAALLAGPHLGRVVLDHRPRASSVAGGSGGSGGSGGAGGADATGAAPPATAAAKPRAKFGIGRGGAKGAAAAAAAAAEQAAAGAEALLSHRNELLRSCCEAMALHGFEPGHLSPPSLAAWVASASGRERLCQLAEQLPQPTDEQVTCQHPLGGVPPPPHSGVPPPPAGPRALGARARAGHPRRADAPARGGAARGGRRPRHGPARAAARAARRRGAARAGVTRQHPLGGVPPAPHSGVPPPPAGGRCTRR